MSLLRLVLDIREKVQEAEREVRREAKSYRFFNRKKILISFLSFQQREVEAKSLALTCRLMTAPKTVLHKE